MRMRTLAMDDTILLDVQQWLSLHQTAAAVRSAGAADASRLRDAWERFYRRNDPFVRATVSACGVGPMNLDDCAQDAWIELSRALPALRLDPSRGSLLAWIRTVVFRVTRDGLRKRAVVFSSESCDLVKSSFDPDIPSPDAEFERRETQASVRTALDAFRGHASHTSFQVLWLVSIEGLSAEETAEQLDLTVPQVWARHHRVKEQFRRFLRASGIS